LRGFRLDQERMSRVTHLAVQVDLCLQQVADKPASETGGVAFPMKCLKSPVSMSRSHWSRVFLCFCLHRAFGSVFVVPHVDSGPTRHAVIGTRGSCNNST
jgi:hypothetical protein